MDRKNPNLNSSVSYLSASTTGLEFLMEYMQPYDDLDKRFEKMVPELAVIQQLLSKVDSGIKHVENLINEEKQEIDTIEMAFDAVGDDWDRAKQKYNDFRKNEGDSLPSFPEDYRAKFAAILVATEKFVTKKLTVDEEKNYKLLNEQTVFRVKCIEKTEERYKLLKKAIQNTAEKYQATNKALLATEDKVMLLVNGPDDIATTDSNSDSNSSDNSPSSSPQKVGTVNTTSPSEVKLSQSQLSKFAVKPVLKPANQDFIQNNVAKNTKSSLTFSK